MKKIVFILWTLFLGIQMAHAKDEAAPRELERAFDRYTKAWINADWERIFEIATPLLQKAYLKDYPSREEWAKAQAKNFKDEISSIERTGTFRITSTLYTFSTITKGKASDRTPFSARGFVSFQFIDDKWSVTEPVVPKEGANSIQIEKLKK